MSNRRKRRSLGVAVPAPVVIPGRVASMSPGFAPEVSVEWGGCPLCGEEETVEGGPCGSCGQVFVTCYGPHDHEDAVCNWLPESRRYVVRDHEACPSCTP